MKSLNELLPVIKDLADNETDYNIVNYYEEMIYSIEKSIVALNNLVSITTYMQIHMHSKLFTTDCSFREENHSR